MIRCTLRGLTTKNLAVSGILYVKGKEVHILNNKSKITFTAVAALFAVTAGVIAWNKSQDVQVVNDESLAQMSVIEEANSSSASSSSVVTESESSSETHEIEPVFDESNTKDPLWAWNKSIYTVLTAYANSKCSNSLEMIQEFTTTDALTADTSSLNSLYETSTAIKTEEAVPGDLCFFKENGEVKDVGISAGHNSVYILKYGEVTTLLISSVGDDFEFRRIYDASNVDEEYLETAASEAGYITLTLDIQTDDPEEDAALFDNDTEGLLKFAQDHISGLSYRRRPTVLYVASVDDTRFQDICEITVVPNNGIGYFVVRYKTDTKTFELVV